MLAVTNAPDGTLKLQATLANASNTVAVLAALKPSPHHPLACAGQKLAYHDDGSLECAHSTTGPDDLRTLMAVQTSIAMLLIVEAMRL